MLALLACPPPALAHEYWLAPSKYRANPRDTVEIEARVGTGFGGEMRPFSTQRAMTLRLRGPRELDLLSAAADGHPVFARFRPADDRGALIGYESRFSTISIPAAEFDGYLADEGLDRALRIRRERGDTSAGRERYARCAKTWIGGAESARVTNPMGLTLELVPLGDPTREPTLRVRVLFRGEPLGGLLVRTWRQPLASGRHAAARDTVAQAAEARTLADGIVTLPLSEPGEYLLSAVHMVPAAEGDAARGPGAPREIPVADWESYWSSLTFERR